VLFNAFLFGGCCYFGADRSPLGFEESLAGGWFYSAGFETHHVPAEVKKEHDFILSLKPDDHPAKGLDV